MEITNEQIINFCRNCSLLNKYNTGISCRGGKDQKQAVKDQLCDSAVVNGKGGKMDSDGYYEIKLGQL